MIFMTEGATQAQQAEANAILEALTTAYPNHPWSVRVYDGGFFIQHLEYDGPWGMNCKTGSRVYSASSLKREVILMAGEWLERAGLARGFGDESPIVRVEGVPEKWQPPEYRAEKFIENAVVNAADFTPLREEPRGQVKAAIDEGTLDALVAPTGASGNG